MHEALISGSYHFGTKEVDDELIQNLQSDGQQAPVQLPHAPQIQPFELPEPLANDATEKTGQLTTITNRCAITIVTPPPPQARQISNRKEYEKFYRKHEYH